MIREGAHRLRSARRCGIELLEDRRLLTFVFTSTDYVVPAGSQAAVIQVRDMTTPSPCPPARLAEDHVELALYAEGADPAVDSPLAHVPIVSTIHFPPRAGCDRPAAGFLLGQSATVPLPAGASGSLALKILGNAPLTGLLPAGRPERCSLTRPCTWSTGPT